MRRPFTDDLPPALARAAREIAARLARRGARAWIVGGAVRDLALGRTPKDLDLATPARPEEIEAACERTVPVGRAFGTVVVPCEGVDIQVTTFRRDGVYSDGRRPDAVEFGDRLDEDAARRDFTCNALYLDPADDALEDPTGGLADLETRVLRAVGDPRRRFAEDGLRLFRLARMAGAHGLSVEPATEAGARAERERVGKVSPERVLAELTAVFEGPGAPVAVGWILELGLLDLCLPDLALAEGERARILDEVSALPEEVGAAAGLAALFGTRVREALTALRASRSLIAAAAETESVAAAVVAGLTPRGRPGGRSARIRLARSAQLAEGLHLARARGAGDAADALAAFAAELGPDEREPAPLLTSADLARSGVERGPRWGELLARAEELQLDGVLRDREAARRWLAEQVDAQDGGKARRSP